MNPLPGSRCVIAMSCDTAVANNKEDSLWVAGVGPA